jgi:hypothetical protein
MAEKQHPLVLVFYLDRELMSNSKIINPFVESVNHIIEIKEMNAVAFFLPTDGEERLECLNPVVVPKIEMEKVSKIIQDLNKHFNVGEDNLKEDQI